MPRAPSKKESKKENAAASGIRVRKPPVIFEVPIELPTKEKKEPQFLTERQNVNGLASKPSYGAMIAKALYECRDPFHGMKLNDICKYIETNYPVKPEYRRFVRLALAKFVSDGLFVQLGPRNYKLSTEERRRMKDGKSSIKKKRSSAKKTGEKKEGTKKRSSAKKEGDEKKKTTKKRTTKNSKEGEKKKTPKKRSTSDKKEVSKKRKSVGKVDDDEDAPRTKKAKKSSSKSEKKSSSGDDNTLIWYWQYYHDGWCNYDPKASEVVEATYQEYLRNPGITDVRSVESGEWNYMVDFRQMTQQNVGHEAHTVRRIRRVQIPKKDAIYRKKFPGTENDKTL